LVDWLEGWGMPRIAAVIVPFVILGLIILAALPMLFSIMGTEDIQKVLGQYVNRTNDLVYNFLDKADDRFVFLEKYKLSESYKNLFDNFIDKHLPNIFVNALLGAFKLFPFFILAPFLAFFILLDGREFKRHILKGVPNRLFEQSLKVFHRFGEQVTRFLRGLFMESFFVGLMASIGLYLLGVPNYLLLGLLTGSLNVVPYLGPATAGILAFIVSTMNINESAILISLFHFSPQLVPLLVVILYVLVRIVDDVLIIPSVMGETLDMHPVVVVVALFSGGEIAGVLGLLLALPVVGVVHVTLKLLVPMLRIRLTREGKLASENYWEADGAQKD